MGARHPASLSLRRRTRLIPPQLPPDAVFIEEGERRFLSGPGTYAHPARTLIPLLPEVSEFGLPESAGLLYLPITLHHVIAQDRVAQLTVEAFWHLRIKLMAFAGGFVLHPDELGEVPAPTVLSS